MAMQQSEVKRWNIRNGRYIVLSEPVRSVSVSSDRKDNRKIYEFHGEWYFRRTGIPDWSAVGREHRGFGKRLQRWGVLLCSASFKGDHRDCGRGGDAFSGEKQAEEMMQIIQNRVQTYLEETQ